MKVALGLVTKAQDNHLRALVLALIASQYFHTAGDHALEMLQTCEQLAAGLGAPPNKPAPKEPGQKHAAPVLVGNAPLGLWVGERFLGKIVTSILGNVCSDKISELFKRAGKESRVQKQTAINAHLAKAVEDLARRAGVATGLSYS